MFIPIKLNHRFPRGYTHPEIVQGTADFHHQIANTLLPQANSVFDNTTTLDTTVDMFDPQPALMQGLIVQLLLHCQLLTTGFLGRHQDVHLRERKR
jgi:hypothetical protein